MDRIVGAVCQPKFLFIGCKGNSVAGAAMAFHWTLFVTLNLYMVELFPCPKIADFEAQQTVHVYENQTASPVYGKRTDDILEWSNGFKTVFVFGSATKVEVISGPPNRHSGHRQTRLYCANRSSSRSW